AAQAARGRGRRIDGETAELPIQADLTQGSGARDLIIGDVVDFEGASVDVAQHQVGRARSVHRGDTSEVPIQSDRAYGGRPGESVVVDVIQFQPAGLAVAQQQIGFARNAAEIADARQ